VPEGLAPVRLDDSGRDVVTLSPDLAGVSMVVLAGPGVIRDGMVDALRDVAAIAGCGVLNTWGAKGLFAWDSPAHLGTGGLQARDFELGGVLDAELLVATGLDPFEAPSDRWPNGFIVEVDPKDLPALVHRWSPSDRVPERPRLYTELQSALAPLYASDAVPLTPARATGDLGQVRPSGGLVLADPGLAGFWVARTFPTTELASIVVPAHATQGFAVAGAIVAGLQGRVALSITTGPLDSLSLELIELAGDWGLPLTLEVWGEDGSVGTPVTRVVKTADALHLPTVDVFDIPVDFALTQTLVDVAGDIVAWGAGSG
jgi:thiamine pyrophosphate-dependent acetolactate synthase large subunit-like protein